MYINAATSKLILVQSDDNNISTWAESDNGLKEGIIYFQSLWEFVCLDCLT